MSDIFISYAREDLERAKRLAEALEAQGWSVFWDRYILPGKTWREVIAKALHEARCVIVAWSEASIASGWVHEEAEEGHERKILVPVFFEEVKPPMGFRGIQAASLVNWDRRPTAEEFQQLVSAVTDILGPLKQPAAARLPGTSHDKISNELPAIPFFRGRRDLLAQIGESLVEAEGGIVLTGMPGVGKTQCAIQYALQHEEDWDLRWWIPADNKLAIDTAYVQLAKRLNLQGAESSSIEVVIDGVKKWLKGHSRWLLIFDKRRVWRHQALHTEPIRREHHMHIQQCRLGNVRVVEDSGRAVHPARIN